MYNRDFGKEINKNRNLDPIELFNAETFTIPSSGAMCKHIQVISEGCDFLCLWLDCDREGENICFEVMDNCKQNLPKPIMDYTFRAKFSSIAHKDIHTAFNDLIYKPNKNEASSVDASQVLDLKIGISFSRLLSKNILNKYPEIKRIFGTNSITYGPCQTPTLGFVVDRAEQIMKFTPEKYWTIDVDIEFGSKNFSLKWNRGKLFNQQCIHAIYNLLSENDSAKAVKVSRKKEHVGKPIGLNTVKMLKVASSVFGISSDRTMKTAEHLYLRGFITYPRTESTSYSSNFNFDEILDNHKSNSEWGDYVKKLKTEGYEKPRSGHDAGDHPPITPVRSADSQDLGDLEWKIYSFISKSFFASISQNAIYEIYTSSFKIGDEDFTLKGRTILAYGFLEVAPWLGST